MAGTVTKPGWEVNDPTQSSSVLKATLPARILPSGGSGIAGQASKLVVKANITNGNYDVYAPQGLLLPDKLLYSVNASNGKRVIADQSAFNSYFNQNTAQGKSQLANLDKSIKTSTLENARLNAGTDPIGQQNYNRIKNTDTYKSVANDATKEPTESGSSQDQQSSSNGGKDNGENEQPEYKIEDLKSPIGRTNYEQKLVYPLDIAETSQDYLKIQMVEYSPRPVQGGIIQPRDNAVGQRTILSTIILPIPGGIGDQNTADWSKKDMDVIDQQVANFADLSIREGGAGAAKSVEQTGQAIKNDPGGVQNLIANKIVKELTRVDVLQRKGAVINQNTELLFNGPGLRSFNFTFKFSPRSKAEGTRVLKIIRTLKQGMSPKTSNEFLYVRAPYTFFLSYNYRTENHPYLNKFKECALTSLSVNYTPDGNYATYHDGSMVSYQVTMAFQELEPVFDSDYGNDYANIGY